MQDPTTMTFSARAAAKDSQIEKIRVHEGNEARLKKELIDTEAQRAKDEEYLVQVALADAIANQALLEKYAHRLPPPPPPPAPEPEVQPDAGNAATGTADPSTGVADSATAAAPAADPASPGAAAGAIPVS